jgi:cytochrome c-type biogenesis protein CcmF
VLSGVVVGVILFVMGARHPLALTTWALGAFVLVIIGTEFWKATRARARIEGEGFVLAFYHLVTRNRRRWGGYIVHVGLVMTFMGFAGAAYNVDVRQHMFPGDVVSVESPFGHTYELTYEGLSMSAGRGQRNLAWQWVALVSVKKDGVPVGNLAPEKRQYTTSDQTMTEVGIRSTPMEDLYLILSAIDNLNGALSGEASEQGIDLQVLVKPLVGWIWFGGLILSFGSLVALWPSVERRRAPQEARTEHSLPAEAVGD